MTGGVASCAVGETLRGRTVTLTLSRVLAFSGGPLDEPGWPHRNLHTDRATALAAGLPDLIASGTQFEGILLTHLVDLFGPAWHRSGELEAKFIRSGRVNDAITPVAIVRAINDAEAGQTVEVEVWCETQAGDKLLVGSARGRRA